MDVNLIRIYPIKVAPTCTEVQENRAGDFRGVGNGEFGDCVSCYVFCIMLGPASFYLSNLYLYFYSELLTGEVKCSTPVKDFRFATWIVPGINQRLCPFKTRRPQVSAATYGVMRRPRHTHAICQ